MASNESAPAVSYRLLTMGPRPSEPHAKVDLDPILGATRSQSPTVGAASGATPTGPDTRCYNLGLRRPSSPLCQ